MTKAEMILNIRRAINEPTESKSIVSDVEIYDYLFKGATIFVRETACQTEFAKATTLADTQLYTFEDWVLKPEIVLWYNGSKWVELEYKTVRQLLTISDFQMFTETGTPEYYFVKRRQIGLVKIPSVNGSADDIKMLCSKMPEELTLDTDEWDEIDETYHETIEFYATFKAWDKIGNETKSKKFFDLFYAGIDSYRESEQETVKNATYRKSVWTGASGFIGRL